MSVHGRSQVEGDGAVALDGRFEDGRESFGGESGNDASRLRVVDCYAIGAGEALCDTSE